MSKKSTSLSKVFVSFGDVASGFKSTPVGVSPPKSTPLPLYTGNDAELVMLSKKLMKKDGVTKLKAIQDLVGVLRTRPEATIAEFLVFFVYGFSKLYVEDHRAIRERLCTIINTVVTIEKRLLAPHMKTLIGPWWTLTGDPIGDVAEAAYTSFCAAIPPKKRQQVLVYLSSFILSEATKNVHLRLEELCDLLVTPFDEAEERLERVIVSTLASIEKFITILTLEQNHQLVVGSGSADTGPEQGANYQDLFTEAMWSKCLHSKFVLVRRTTFQLIATIALNVPEVVASENWSGRVSFSFCKQFVNGVMTETNVLNLNVLLNSLVTTLTQVPDVFTVISVVDDIIPALFHLLKSYPQLALEYTLPIAGSLPAAQIALLELLPIDATAAIRHEQSLQGMCSFLQQLSVFAELQAAEGSLQTIDSHIVAKVKSGRRNTVEKLSLTKQTQQLGVRAECVVQGIHADVCVVELATLLLLRRANPVSTGSVTHRTVMSDDIHEVIAQLVQSIVVTTQSAATALRHDITQQKGNAFRKAIECAVRYEILSNASSVAEQVLKTANTALEAIGRSLLQLQRASQMEMHLSRGEWSRVLWEPLSDGLLDLLLVTSTGPSDGAPASETEIVALMIRVTSLMSCIVRTLSPSWQERSAHDASQSGACVVKQKLIGFATTRLRADEIDTVDAVLLNQLILCLSDHGAGDGIVALDIRDLLSGVWLTSLVSSLSGVAGPHSSSVSHIFSACLVDLVAFANQSESNCAAEMILSQCVRANSIECVSLVCKATGVTTASNSNWDSNAIAWALHTGTDFLQTDVSVSSADLRTQVRFMLLICAQPACSRTASEWFEVAKTRWCAGLGNKLADWFILTLVAVALKQSQNLRFATNKATVLPEDLLAAVTAWLKDNPTAIPNHLRSLFFARLRNRDTKYGGKKIVFTELSVLSDVNVVMSWTDVQKLLLPNFTTQMRMDLYSSIAQVLNSSLTLADSSPLDGADEGEDQESNSAPQVTGGLHPKKWARHACALLSAQQSTTALESINLFSVTVWAEYLQRVLNGSSATDAWANQKRLSFALESLHFILSGEAADEDGQIGSALAHTYLVNQPMLMFWILLGAKQSLRILTSSSREPADTSQHLLLQLFASVPMDLRAPFFKDMLDVALDKSNDSHQLRDLRIAVVKNLLEKEFIAKPNPRELLRLKSPSIRRDERPALGLPGQFLSWKVLPNTDPLQTSSSSASSTDSPELIKITPIACKLAGVHREAGSDPYFTITMDQTGDAQVAHELQVEWPKIIVGKNLPLSRVDLVWNYQRGTSAIPLNAIGGKFDSLTLDACTHWLEDTLREILQEVTSTSVGGENVGVAIFHQCALYADVLCALCDHLLNAPSATKEKFEVRVTAHVRGIVSYLLSPQCATSTFVARCAGLLLFQALVRSQVGTGAGLWLPAALNHVRNIVASIVSSSASDNELEAAYMLSHATSTLAQVLTVVSHSDVCLDCAESLLPTALAALPSPSTTLGSDLLLLLAAVWRHRSDSRDDKADVPVLGTLSSWETEGFDFCMFVMVEGLIGQSAQVRLNASRAVHFCLLKRSRKSCRELMAPSLVSRFAEQLQQIAVCDPSADTSLLHYQALGPSVLNTLRVTCCKVLDAFEASRSDCSTGSGDAMVEADALDTASEISLQEQERLELEHDGHFLNDLIGGVYAAELTRRLIITQADIDRVGPSADVRTDDGDDEEGPTTPVTESQSGGRAGGRKISKRATLHYMSSMDPLGSVLLWLLLLQSIDSRAVEGWMVRARCVNCLKNTGMSSNMLHLLIRLSGDMLKFRDVSALLQRVEAVYTSELEEDVSGNRPHKHSDYAKQHAMENIPVGTIQHLAVYALFRTVCTLPAMFRTFWSDDCTRVQKTRLSKFVEERVRESLMKREVALIATSSAAGRWDANEFAVRGSIVSGEVTAVLSKEETTVEIKVKLPASYPLKIVEVACTSRIGVSDGRWRRWVLQIIQLLGMQDGSVVDAVLMWKCNIEKELEGVEPCPICYCTLHTKTLSLPSMACPTCNNKFHSPCLSTWFKSSGKSKCVICQQPFFN